MSEVTIDIAPALLLAAETEAKPREISLSALISESLENFLPGEGDPLADFEVEYGFREIAFSASLEESKRPPLEIPAPEEVAPVNPYTGKRIVFTGFAEREKSALFAAAEAAGVKRTSAVSARTDFLVCSFSAGPAKRQKARELGIPEIEDRVFLRQIVAKEE